MQTHASLKAMLQLVLVALYVHVMALFERTEWGIFRKGKGEIICQITSCMHDGLANRLKICEHGFYPFSLIDWLRE
jgi:hypothetical protein